MVLHSMWVALEGGGTLTGGPICLDLECQEGTFRSNWPKIPEYTITHYVYISTTCLFPYLLIKTMENKLYSEETNEFCYLYWKPSYGEYVQLWKYKAHTGVQDMFYNLGAWLMPGALVTCSGVWDRRKSVMKGATRSGLFKCTWWSPSTVTMEFWSRKWKKDRKDIYDICLNICGMHEWKDVGTHSFSWPAV